jgi:hypothetical protein
MQESRQLHEELRQLHEEFESREMECRELTAACGSALARLAVARAESKAKNNLLEESETR